MASHLIGVPVTVSLKYPPQGLVQGLVAHIDDKTFTLTLRDVFFPATGQRFPEYTVASSEILDITVAQPTENAPPPVSVKSQQPHPAPAPPRQQQQQQQQQPQPPPPLPPARTLTNPYPTPLFVPPQVQPVPFHQQEPLRRPPQLTSPPLQTPRATTVQAAARKPFVDPAILSVGRKPSIASAVEIPTTHSTPTLPQEAPSTPIKPVTEAATAGLPVKASPFIGVPKKPATDAPAKRNQTIAATLSEPFTGLQISAERDEANDSDELPGKEGVIRSVSLTKTRTGKPMDGAPRQDDMFKKTRRGKGKKKDGPPQGHQLPNVETTPDAARKANPNGAFKSKGWRQTPLLQAAEGDSPRTPGVISGKVGLAAVNASNRKARKQRALEAKNGWATEDATDIQELPDFDFASNLSKFDKRAVFEQIRNEDTTADEDRLVTFNRLPKPGTYGGKNLHPTENVLDNPKARMHSNSFSSTESEGDFDSGRNSRRAMSRASTKRVPYRQGSGLQAEDLSSYTAASALLSRSKSSLNRPAYASSSLVSGSPKPSSRQTPPESPSPFLSPVLPVPPPRSTTTSSSSSSLRVISTNRTCHCITPGGMTAVEETAELDFGLTEDILAESAGRGIADVALSNLNPGGRRLARENLALNTRPVIVALAGNQRSGARCVAAARHLHLRGARVMVAVLGYERDPGDWDRDLRRQVQLLKKLGGLVRGWAEVEEALRKLEAPPELIIDALLGRAREFEALGEADRREAMRIVGWANKSRASVLAVEGPSGVGGSTGEISILEGEPLEVRAKHVVCLGAPRSGLLRALQNGVGRPPEREWTIWVVDLGLNRPWKKSGVAAVGAAAGAAPSRAYGVPFGGEWVVQVRYVEGEEVERERER